MNQLRTLSFHGIGLHNSKHVNNGGIKRFSIWLFGALFIAININLFKKTKPEQYLGLKLAIRPIAKD